MRGLAIVALVLLLLPAAAFASGKASPRCNAIEPDRDVVFDGLALREIPTIEAPELRHINALLTAQCFAEVDRALASYVAAHPEDHKVAYVQARDLWMTGHATQAASLLSETIAKYPDFASAYVSLAGLAIANEDYAEAKRLLDIAEPLAPTDLWLMVDRLRIAASTSPDALVAEHVVRVMEDGRFRGGIRYDMAVLVLGPLYGQVDSKALDRAYRLNIEMGNQVYQDRVVAYAAWLIESEQRTAEARQWLEPLLTQPLHDPEDVHKLIAESWLFDAARIDPVQTSRNFALIEKARNELGGNIDMLARAAALDPAFAPLHGFFKIVENVDKPDDIGDTGLCLALMSFTLDISMIKDLLDNLADPNQKCRGIETTPVGVVLTQGNGSTAQRSELLKLLLDHGGDPNPTWFQWHAKEFCKNENRCVPLLPVLEPAWAAWDAKTH